MTFVPVPFRRRLPLVQPDPTTPVLTAGLGQVPVITATPSTITPSEASSGTESAKGSRIPPRWAVSLVALVLILVSALIGLGHPVSHVLEALAGGGYLGIELVRLLNREL